MNQPVHCILLIDDDPDDNYLHQLIISESGLCQTTRVAESGTEALRYLTQTNAPDYLRPDMIMLDINMPGMNGFEFLDQYHQLPDEQKSRLVVLMLTTSLNPDDRHRAGSIAEVTDYQAKPLTQAMLRQLVADYFPEPA